MSFDDIGVTRSQTIRQLKELIQEDIKAAPQFYKKKTPEEETEEWRQRLDRRQKELAHLLARDVAHDLNAQRLTDSQKAANCRAFAKSHQDTVERLEESAEHYHPTDRKKLASRAVLLSNIVHERILAKTLSDMADTWEASARPTQGDNSQAALAALPGHYGSHTEPSSESFAAHRQQSHNPYEVGSRHTASRQSSPRF